MPPSSAERRTGVDGCERGREGVEEEEEALRSVPPLPSSRSEGVVEVEEDADAGADSLDAARVDADAAKVKTAGAPAVELLERMGGRGAAAETLTSSAEGGEEDGGSRAGAACEVAGGGGEGQDGGRAAQHEQEEACEKKAAVRGSSCHDEQHVRVHAAHSSRHADDVRGGRWQMRARGQPDDRRAQTGVDSGGGSSVIVGEAGQSRRRELGGEAAAGCRAAGGVRQ